MGPDCLNEATVIEFIDGVLPAGRWSSVAVHLNTCGECAELVGLAAGGPRAHTAAKVSPDPLPAGSRVGRYQILERVGQGGMGQVYAAYHPDLDRRIALKLVHESAPESEDRQARLLREAHAIARLSHPNVIAVYDAGTVEDRVYVAMEFIDGVTIDRWLATEKRSWREIVDVFVAAGRGLSRETRATAGLDCASAPTSP